MKKFILLCLMTLTLAMPSIAQENVKREGKNFVQVSQRSTAKERKTEYTYTNTKGEVFPVYLSSTGKAFIKKHSKKTGKEYRQYLPEVGKEINPSAYKEEDSKSSKKEK